VSDELSEHVMHEESFSVDEVLAAQVAAARRAARLS